MGFSNKFKILIGVCICGVFLAGGIIVGILAAVGVFSSDDTTSTTTSIATATTNLTCSACVTASGCTPVSGTTNTCNLPYVNFKTGSGTTQFTLTSNNWPCHALDGNSYNYVNCPTEYTSITTIPTVTPCSTGQYYDQLTSACTNYILEHWFAPYLGVVGVFGRVATKSVGWSTTNVPQEAVFYDPLHTECTFGSTYSLSCKMNMKYDGWYSVPDVVRLTAARGTTIEFLSGTSEGISEIFRLDSFNGHVKPHKKPNGIHYGIYHYHAGPSWDDGTYADYVIGYAIDGYPIMGRNSVLTNGLTATSNYAFRDHRGYYFYHFDGRYHINYTYSPSNGGTLDELNGGMFTIDGVSTWAYASTSTYPYCIWNFKGTPLMQ